MMNESILIVDDNQTTRDNLQAILQSEGYKVDTCEDGISAIIAAKAQRYDTFIVDYRMPSMMGDELTKILRDNVTDAFIIGYSLECRDEDFRSAGANAFLTKDRLVQRIVPLIQGRFQIF
jgi:CheY-like chemotaxis protein